MLRPPLLSTFGLILATGGLADAQQVLEIDFEGGRTIIDDEWRAMYSHLTAVDWDRNVLYVRDAEEPEGIMAFSLETGEWIRTIPTPKGDGPYEFAQGARDIAIGPGGGLNMSGFVRVVEYDPEGVPIDSWRPEVPVPRKVCNLGGAPAVPTQGGVVMRGPDGTSVAIGPVRAQGRSTAPEAASDVGAIWERLRTAHIACSDRPDGSLIRPERPCPHWSKDARLSFDDRGNVVLLGIDGNTHGAVIHPETGCYALIRGTSEHPHTPIGVHSDSVLVLRRPFEITRRGNDTFISITDSGNGLSLHALRRVSGDPCPGMLE